jgi:hypothetical protein
MEEEKANGYALSQDFHVHADTVRCCDAFQDTFITGSLDRTVKVFKLLDNKYV